MTLLMNMPPDRHLVCKKGHRVTVPGLGLADRSPLQPHFSAGEDDTIVTPGPLCHYCVSEWLAEHFALTEVPE